MLLVMFNYVGNIAWILLLSFINLIIVSDYCLQLCMNLLSIENFPNFDISFATQCQEPMVFQPLLIDPTQVESKKSSQIQWPVPSINAEPVDIFLGEE